MPDWVTHLGTTYIAAQAVSAAQTVSGFRPALIRSGNIRHLLVGALLPDATRFAVILVDILDWPAIPTFTYLIPFHSLLIVGLVCAALALIFPAGSESNRRAFYLLLSGALFHFLLDDLEGLVGCGSTTFYPFYFGKPLNGWAAEGNFATSLLVLAAIGIGAALVRCRQWPAISIRLSRYRLVGAISLLIVAAVLPLFFQQRMIDQNAYDLGFVTQPLAFEGQSVELCFSEIIATEPVTIEEFDVAFAIQTSEHFVKGDWLSIRGVYQDGHILPTTIVRHRGFSDVTLSLIAACAFGWLMSGQLSVKGGNRSGPAKRGVRSMKSGFWS